MRDELVYVGDYLADGRAGLWLEDRDLLERRPVQHLDPNSARGFAWGYGGRGPDDTALAILHDACGRREAAERLHQQFSQEVIGQLRMNQPFQLPHATVAAWLVQHGVPEADAPRRLPVAPRVATPDLLDRVAEMEARERAVEARERRADQRERRLERRSAALQGTTGVEARWSVPAGPVVAQVRALVEGTGDDLATVAKGLDLEVEWVVAVVEGRITEVDIPHVQALCETLHCTPYDFWGTETARSIAHAYPPDLWPRFIEPLAPPDIDHGLEPPGLGPDLGI